MRRPSNLTAALSTVACLVAACGPSTPNHDGGTDVATDIAMSDVASDVPPDEGVDAAPSALPDLTVDQGTLQGDLQFAMQYFAPNACELGMDEACVGGPGWRRLLMFTTLTPNVGSADLNLGNASMSNPNFTYSTCHEHYHYLGYADYSLVGGDGGVAAEGHKQSFCVEDLVQVDTSPSTHTMPRFDNCGEGAGGLQGIQSGWADEYYPNLPCQWIDVTDVPPGAYTLRVSLNYMHRFAEADYSNNIVEVPVTVPANWATSSAGGPDPTRNCGRNDPEQGIGRDCDWRVEGTHTCTPGQSINVGCNDSCGAGSCMGNWLIRVCKGSGTCLGGDNVNVLQQDYGLCGSNPYRLTGDTCPDARFTCPAEGQYTVMVAPNYTGSGHWSPGMDPAHADPNLGYCVIQTVVSGGGDGGVGDAGGSSDASADDASSAGDGG